MLKKLNKPNNQKNPANTRCVRTVADLQNSSNWEKSNISEEIIGCLSNKDVSLPKNYSLSCSSTEGGLAVQSPTYPAASSVVLYWSARWDRFPGGNTMFLLG